MGNDLLFDCGIGILYRNWRLWQCIGLAFKCLVSWFFVATLQPVYAAGVYIYKKYCSIPRNDLVYAHCRNDNSVKSIDLFIGKRQMWLV